MVWPFLCFPKANLHLAYLMLTYRIAFLTFQNKRTMGKTTCYQGNIDLFRIRQLLWKHQWTDFLLCVGCVLLSQQGRDRQCLKRLWRQEPSQGACRDLQQFTALEVKDTNAPSKEGSCEMGPLLWEEPCALHLPISPSVPWVSGNSHSLPLVRVWASEANTWSTTLVCVGLYTSSCGKKPYFFLMIHLGMLPIGCLHMIFATTIFKWSFLKAETSQKSVTN